MIPSSAVSTPSATVRKAPINIGAALIAAPVTSIMAPPKRRDHSRIPTLFSETHRLSCWSGPTALFTESPMGRNAPAIQSALSLRGGAHDAPAVPAVLQPEGDVREDWLQLAEGTGQGVHGPCRDVPADLEGFA